jgi:hypothetical protein
MPSLAAISSCEKPNFTLASLNVFAMSVSMADTIPPIVYGVKHLLHGSHGPTLPPWGYWPSWWRFSPCGAAGLGGKPCVTRDHAPTRYEAVRLWCDGQSKPNTLSCQALYSV